MTMMIAIRNFRLLRNTALTIAVAMVVPLLSSCGAVGKGNKPIAMTLLPASGQIGDTSTKIFQCFAGSVGTVIYFSDGSAGTYTGRTHWSSSNPDVVQVSNGEMAVPGATNQFYAPGTLIGVSPGTATVTGTYLTFSQSIQVEVDTPTDLKISKVDQNVPVPASSVVVAPGTTQSLTVSGDFDGVERDLQGQAAWSLDPADDSVATIDSSAGTVTGVGTGGPLNVVASFNNCDLQATIPLDVKPIQSVSITPQFGSDADIVGNIERFDAFIDFGNGPEQDVSTQATWTSSNTDEADFSSSGLPNYLDSTNAGDPITVTASVGDPAVSATPVNVQLVSANLLSFSISPSEATVVAANQASTQYPGTGSQIIRYKATGRFDNGQTQDVTNVVGWSAAPQTMGVMDNVLGTKGFATAAGTATGSVTITGEDDNAAENPLATAQLDVVSAPSPP